MGFHLLLKGQEKKPVGHQLTDEQSPNLDKGNPLTRAALMGSTLHIVYTIHDCSLKALFEMQLATTFDKTPKHLQALP